MRKYKLTAVLIALLLIVVGCSKKDEAKVESNAGAEVLKLNVAASPSPHAVILESIVDDLAAEGIELTITEFTDYVMPNTVVFQGEIEANYFQHGPYLDDFNDKNDTDLVSVGTVHIEPIAAYSNVLKNIDELSDGAAIAIPNDPTNGARALLLLDANGIIKLEDNTNPVASVKEIIENPKNLEIVEAEAAQLPALLPDVELAVINGNYAIGAGLNPVEDSLLIEGEDSFYTNIIAVKPENAEDPRIKKLIEVIQSDSVKDFIAEEFKGAVIPAF